MVIVPERATASTLINKGSFGTPLKGGGLELTMLEATYLVDSDRLDVKVSRKGRRAGLDELLGRGMADDRMFIENFLVYRDIRNRGLNIQGDGRNTFMSYPRGRSPGNGKADRWITVNREHDPVSARELHNEATRREGMRMELLAAVVDGDFDITYYRIESTFQEGEGPVDHLNIELASGHSMEVHGGGLVAFSGPVSERAKSKGMGKHIGRSILLSIEESSFLTGKRSENTMKGLRDLVYRDLLSRGYLVKTGFKYGTHFRVYTSGDIDDHSDLLVHCVDGGHMFTWEELSRAIRLSNSVRKKMLFAFDGDNEVVNYLMLGWTRP